MHGLHVLARLALHSRPPLEADRIVRFAACRISPLRDLAAARIAFDTLRSHGSCLSRAISIAARLPEAQVVIGVDPRRSNGLTAHAWVELGGAILEGPEPGVEEIARFP
jgi:hypothetical protein